MSVAVRVPETIDPVGIETLLRMADVEAYNDWVYRQIRPYMGDRVLEVGCGIGNMTGYYADRPLLVCVDLLAESLALAREKIGDRPNLHLVQGDICADATVERLAEFQFDTAIMLNVLEHIPDDVTALACIQRLLPSRPSGRVPGRYHPADLHRPIDRGIRILLHGQKTGHICIRADQRQRRIMFGGRTAGPPQLRHLCAV